MGSGLEVASCVNLCGFSQLEGEHISRNADFGDIGETIFGIEAACFEWELDLFSILVSVECRGEGSE